MESVASYIGNKIRFFRKLNGLSISELAEMIHKSKATLSKYENGLITIDIEALNDIARALRIDIRLFFDYENSKPEKDENISQELNPFFKKNSLYIYYYDGRKKSIVKSLLAIQSPGSEKLGCTFYMDVPSFDRCDDCNFYYIGELSSFDVVTYAALINQTNRMERLGLCILNPFQRSTNTWGFMCGISCKPITPFALKFMITNTPVRESDLSPKKLSLTADEIKMIKNLNIMLLLK